MGFINAVIGGVAGYAQGGPLGAVVGAAGGMMADSANKKSEQQFNQSTEIAEKSYQNLDPYRQAGNAALSKYMELLGLEQPVAPAAAGAAPGAAPVGGGGNGSGLVGIADWTEEDEREWNNMYASSDHPPDPRRKDQLMQKRINAKAARNSGAAPAAAPAAAGGAPGVPNMGAPGTGGPAQPNALGPSQSIYDKLRDTPGYKFQTQEEERAINRAAAGRGQFMSGNVLEELSSRAGERAMGTAYQGQLSALSGLAAAGQNAAVGQGGIASNVASQRYNIAGQAQDARDATTGSTISLLDQALQAYQKSTPGGAVSNGGYTSVIPMPTMSN